MAALGKNQDFFYFYFSLSSDVLDSIKEIESEEKCIESYQARA